MFAGFKKFLMQGNVVELAVAVVIGGAVTAIVTSLTDKIIQPLLNSLGGNDELGLGFEIISGNQNTYLDFGAVISALINFVIVAFIVYYAFITPMNKMKESYNKANGINQADSEATETDLLLEIRDLLKAQNGNSHFNNR